MYELWMNKRGVTIAEHVIMQLKQLKRKLEKIQDVIQAVLT